MRPSRVGWLGRGVAVLALGLAPWPTHAIAQAPGDPNVTIPVFADAPQNPSTGDSRIKPLTEGPLHEAFLSKAKDREPFHVPKAPPEPVVERPAVDPTNPKAQWIEGYYDWDVAKNDFVWVTGT